jgi:sulfur carrier protein ThiS adenylyltransferase
LARSAGRLHLRIEIRLYGVDTARVSGHLPSAILGGMIDYWRQLDLVSPSDLDFDVNLIGVGGLGSPIAMALAKMGCPRITLFDDDTVEPHNLPNQLYRMADIGLPKVEALARILREYVDADITPVNERVTGRTFKGVVISAVDSMAARRVIWDNCVRYKAGVKLYIDARMGGEVGRILTVSPANPMHVEAYEGTLFTDEEGSTELCTAQATIYSTFGVASLVSNQVKRFARGESLTYEQIIDFSTSMLLTVD